MKFILITFLMSFSLTAGADAYSIKCNPELGSGDETITATLDFERGTLDLLINGTAACRNAEMTRIEGEMADYGEGEADFACGAYTITVRNDFDETVVSVPTKFQRIYGLSDYAYQCW